MYVPRQIVPTVPKKELLIENFLLIWEQVYTNLSAKHYHNTIYNLFLNMIWFLLLCLSEQTNYFGVTKKGTQFLCLETAPNLFEIAARINFLDIFCGWKFSENRMDGGGHRQGYALQL